MVYFIIKLLGSMFYFDIIYIGMWVLIGWKSLVYSIVILFFLILIVKICFFSFGIY